MRKVQRRIDTFAMDRVTQTNTILLVGLLDPRNDDAWNAFHKRFRPLLIAYGRRRGLQHADAEDAAQEALTDFVKAYRKGQYERSRGRLRHWLGAIAANRVSKFLGALARQPQPLNREGRTGILNALPDPASPDQTWEREWERHLLKLCKKLVRHEFSASALRAFEEYAIKQRPAIEVAHELGMSRNALYACKSRILQRMRELRTELDADL